jgi:hypothetical protein
MPREDRPLLRKFIRELRWVIRHARGLARLLFSDPKERERFLRCTGTNPVLGAGAKEHGLWCLLWERHPDPALLHAFRALQSQALLAQLAILRHWQQRDDWASANGPSKTILHSLYVRTLAIRHFVMSLYVSMSEYRCALSRVSVRGARADHLAALRRIRAALRRNGHSDEELPPILNDVIAIIGLLKCADEPDGFRGYSDDVDDGDVAIVIDPNENSTETMNAQIEEHEDPAEAGEVEVELIDDCDDEDDEDEDEEEEEEDDDDDEGNPEQGDDDDNRQMNDNDEGGDEDASTSICFIRKWTAEEKKACSEAGVHPAEVLPTEMFLLSDRRSGGSRTWFARDNQLHSLSLQNLAMEELALGFEALRRTADHGGLCDLELLTVATATLARGLTTHRTRSLVARSDRPPEVDVLTLFLPVNADAPAEWIVPTVPAPHHEIGEAPQAGCRKCEKCFPLPDYWGLGTLMRRLIRLKFPDWCGEPIQPFAGSQEKAGCRTNYGRRLKDCLRRQDPDLAKSLKKRFTLPRIGRVLFQTICDQTLGNIVPATYATQRKHRCGEVPRYYETPQVRTIQIIERRAVAGIHAELVAVGCSLPVDLSLKPSSSSGYVGSPLCPLIESVQGFLKQTLDTIVQADSKFKQSDDIADMIARHNAFTAHTFVGVTVGTCHRPSHGGIPDFDAIDEFTGMLSIVDKGVNKARLSTAADAAVTQRGALQNYVDTFDFAKYLGKAPGSKFFFLGPDGEVLPVTPSTLKVHVPFVANFARHLVRTELSDWCEQGDERLSPERLNALLGHASEGEEPYGAHSSFDYSAFAEAMRSALGDLLNQIGFRPVTIHGEEVAVHDPAVRRFLGFRAA